jgi:hypothetical protein
MDGALLAKARFEQSDDTFGNYQKLLFKEGE